MSWSPQASGLSELVQLLRQSGTGTTASQDAISKRLDSFEHIPDYPGYLANILTEQPDESPHVRALAGILLKNTMRARLASVSESGLSPEVLNYVKSASFLALGDKTPLIRNTAGTVIDQMFLSLTPEWSEALQRLAELAFDDSGAASKANGKEGAFSCLAKICEDAPHRLEQMQVNGHRPLETLIPLLLRTLDSTSSSNDSSGRIRVHALSCCTQFVYQQADNPLVDTHMEQYVQALFRRASDQEPDIRKLVCQSVVNILATAPEHLMGSLDAVVEFMLFSTSSAMESSDRTQDEESVSLEACEFWLTWAEDAELADALRPYLGRVAPVLLRGMRYSASDLMLLEDDDDDAAVPDREQDIKPTFHTSKTKTMEREPEANGSKPKDKDGEEEDDEGLDDEDDEDGDAYTEWNLRKCSAAAMDVLAVNYRADLLDILLPHLKEMLWGGDWLNKESAILALGAVAEGCMDAIAPYLPEIIPFLRQTCEDPKPLVRSIACWTLGRYSAWCVGYPRDASHSDLFFVPTVETLLRMVLDNNKRVQEAGCSAFATLEEEAQDRLEPFLGPILQNLVFAFNKYQQKNLLILYDAIGTLADAVGSALNKPDLIDTLIPALIEKWKRLQDEDKDLIPLLECMSSVVTAIGPGFVDYAPPVYQRCARLVEQSLLSFQTWQSNPEIYEPPDKTFLIVALDLLSGLTQGLGTQIVPLLATEPHMLPMLHPCLIYPDAPVRQSAYALLGDCAISCFDQIRPLLPQVLPELVQQMDSHPKAELVSVCNNAAWAAGEIALQCGHEMAPFVPPLLDHLVPILLSVKAARSLTENSAVTIGRLGLACPDLVARHLETFIAPWCNALADIKDNDEKDSAFRGICAAIQVNPNGITKSFDYFLYSVARWSRPSPELKEMFRTLLNGFKQLLGPQWDSHLQALPPAFSQRLVDLESR